MEKLKLSKDVELPLEVITERLACVGQSGSGKTYAAMRLAELMLEAGAQVVALDPMGVWWGLLSAADDKASGYPVHVFGGEHEHVPIVPEAGALVAEVIVHRGISAVIDVSHFTRSEQVMFSSAFAERFYELQVKVKRPVHLFFEEAHTVLPQNLPAEGRGGDPQKNPAVLLNRMERIVRQGRSQGIGCTMITQQPQAVNKAALNQAGTLLAMRTMGKHERKAIADWMADKATDDAQLKLDQLLPKLGTGEAWVASPHFLGLFVHTRVSKKRTFDSSATPKFGVKLEAPKVLAAVDVEALREAMKTVVEEVEKDDPAPLRRRIAELERQLAAKPAPAPVKVEVPVISQGDLAALNAFFDRWNAAREAMAREGEELCTAVSALAHRVISFTAAETRPLHVPAQWVPALTRPKTTTGQAPKLEGTGLKKGAREMLRELAALHPRTLTRRELATRAIMAHAGGSTGDYISALKSAGFVVEAQPGEYIATEAGLEAAGPVTPKSAAEIVALWKNNGLKRGARAMLDVSLSADRDHMLTREQLAAEANMEASGGSTGDYLSALVSAGCLDRVDQRRNPDPHGRFYLPGHALFMGDQ